MNGRQRILALLDGQPVERTPAMPITMMFAADQIRVPYREYATDYRVLAEAQIETSRRFHFDYVSAISDPAREAADLGADIEWFDDQPPAIIESRALLDDKKKIDRLTFPDPLESGRMKDRVDGVALLKKRIGTEKLVEGWVEGPCAQAADLRGINTLMLDLMDDPGFVLDLFKFVVELELRFARAQIDAGADLIGIGDAAASLVGPRIYREYVFPFEKELVEGIQKMGALTRLHVCGRTGKLLPWMTQTGADIIDLDWMVPLADARCHAGPAPVLLGNIDPVAVLRNGAPEDVATQLATCHSEAGPRYIVGAGCEVVRDTPAANVEALVQYARNHRPTESLEVG